MKLYEKTCIAWGLAAMKREMTCQLLSFCAPGLDLLHVFSAGIYHLLLSQSNTLEEQKTHPARK